MEISSLSTLQKAGRVEGAQAKSPVTKTEPQDALSLSAEARETQKIEEWVTMLREMPDVRPEAIEKGAEAAISSSELASTLLQSQW